MGCWSVSLSDQLSRKSNMNTECFYSIRLIALLMLLSVCLGANAQNLVPNPSFSYPNDCESNSLPANALCPWFVTASTLDFYHPCFPSVQSVPFSIGGGEAPFNGEGYVGLYTFSVPPIYREFVSVELTAPLVEQVGCHVTFYLSRMDSSWYATKEIGRLFSENVPESNFNFLLSQQPQVKHEGDTFLTNSDGWTKIEGSFIAAGGERYLTIGNFKNDSQTDTLFVEGAE
jgi:OOP family OmpA-OmpF porin